MGSNKESDSGGHKGNVSMRTPLYSNGTPEMDGKSINGSVDGPEKCPDGTMSYATQLNIKK